MVSPASQNLINPPVRLLITGGLVMGLGSRGTVSLAGV